MNDAINRILLGLLLLAIGGCASVPLDLARAEFERGQYQEAVEILDSGKIRSKDKLLAQMEKGLIQHQAGDFAGSSQTFLAASALLKSSDYISVSEQGSALIVNDSTTTYRGEYSEQLWIHTYQMMNFLLLNNAESAAVEARQALKLLGKHGDTLEGDWFTRALLGVVFDSAGQPNSAYIEYRKLAESMPDPEALAAILFQRAKTLGFSDDAQRYAKLTPDAAKQNETHNAELIVFVADGRIPKKRSGNLYIYPDVAVAFPYYDYIAAGSPDFKVTADSGPVLHSKISTDLGELAKTSLAARGKTIVARQTARAVTKHALVDLAESESETSAAILQAVLLILEFADTRAWQTLPANLTLLRIPLTAGEHELVISDGSENFADSSVIGPTATLQINVKPGQRLFRQVRF